MERGLFCTNFINRIANQKARGCSVEQSKQKLRDDHFYKSMLSTADQMEESDMLKIIRWQNFRESTVIFQHSIDLFLGLQNRGTT